MVTRREFLQGLSSASILGQSAGITRKNIHEHGGLGAIESLVLSGFLSPGDRGAGAHYIRGTQDGPLAVQDQEGIWWNLAPPSNEVWAGWFGVLGAEDDTAALQLAIDHVAEFKDGGTVRIAAGHYKIAARAGGAEIAAHDDGKLGVGTAHSIAPEPVRRQAYAICIKDKVRMVGEFGTFFEGAYTFGSAGENELICLAVCSSGFASDICVEQITFRNYFFAFAAPAANLVFARFNSLRFEDCAIGLYSRGFERCYLDALSAQGTGCVVAIGGQWCSRVDDYHEGGGFADKTYFGVIHNIYQRVMGDAEARIDAYFDEVFYKSRNDSTRLGPPVGLHSIVRNFRYLGLCGRAVYLMARYGRPHNANTFRLISHAYAPRAAVWIDAAVACTAEVVYLESCGYRDNVKRVGPIGVSFVDPFLGSNVRVPAFVKGVNCHIDAQMVFCDRLAIGNEFADRFVYASNIASPSRFRSMKDEVVASSLSVWHASGAARSSSFLSFELEPNTSLNLGEQLQQRVGARQAAMIFASTNPDGGASVYLVSLDKGAAEIPAVVLAGIDTLQFVRDERGQILMKSRSRGKRITVSVWAH